MPFDITDCIFCSNVSVMNGPNVARDIPEQVTWTTSFSICASIPSGSDWTVRRGRFPDGDRERDGRDDARQVSPAASVSPSLSSAWLWDL